MIIRSAFRQTFQQRRIQSITIPVATPTQRQQERFRFISTNTNTSSSRRYHYLQSNTTSSFITTSHRHSSNTTTMSANNNKPSVHGLFHKGTSTMTYIISDPDTKQTIILDSVLDYDASSGRTSNAHGEEIVQYCTENELDVRYILESHVHGTSILTRNMHSCLTRSNSHPCIS